MFYVYVLQSEVDSKLYIGFTSNLKKRLKEHNDGLSKATKFRKPFRLVYCEVYTSLRDGRIRERKLKQFKNSYTELKKRLKYSLEPKSGGGRKVQAP